MATGLSSADSHPNGPIKAVGDSTVSVALHTMWCRHNVSVYGERLNFLPLPKAARACPGAFVFLCTLILESAQITHSY